MRYATLLFIAFAAFPAFAQQQAPNVPCTRGRSTIVMAGVNLDEMKCRLAVAEDALSAQVSQSIAMKSQLLMLQSDLAAAKAEAEADKARADLEKSKTSQTKPSSK